MSQEKSREETEYKQQTGRRPAAVCFRFTVRRALAASLILLAAAVFCVLDPALFRDEETGAFLFDLFFWAYWGLALSGAVLCLLKVDLPGTVRRAAGWIISLLLPLGAFYAVDLINGTRVLSFSHLRLFANYLCYLMVFAFLYAVSRRVWVTALAGGALFLFFGIVNYFVVQFRGQPILPLDLQSIGTAVEVAEGYKFTFTRSMALSVECLLCTVLLCRLVAPVGKSEDVPSRRSRIAERVCALMVSVVLAVLIFPCDILTSMGISVWPWNQKVSSELTGVMAGFFGNVQFMMVDKPEDYSAERVEELGEEISSAEVPEALGSPGEEPTIIVVMNESMTDFLNMGNVEFTQDNLPFLHSLQQSGNTIWGTAYSSVYGGNTCNSEYEFLTGNTTAFFPSGSIPYQQYVTHSQTALPSILKSYGYQCTAIHPGNRGAWQRDKAYPFLGFDEFIAAKDFTVTRDMVHGLTSDLSCYRQVVKTYADQKGDGPQFILNVTIQNHGGFEDEDVETTVRVKGHEGEWPQTEQYLSLTKQSDDDLRYLIEYFSEEESPVVVLFFGDHWPNLETGFLSQLLGTDADDPGFEDLMRERQVPFLIWANYPLEGCKIENISLNYLSGLLLRAAGLEGTDYTNFLEGLREQLPVINALGFMDCEGNLYKNGEESPYDQPLNQYAVLQYNNVFGGKEKDEGLFTREG